MAKKRKNNTPRFKKMKRSQRLASGEHWIAKYTGKHIVRDYRKRYGVDSLCAIIELKMLGVSIDPEYVARVKQSVEGKQKHRKRLKEKERQKRLNELFADSNDEFYYIVGYTSGGAPYGTTWEQMGLEPYELTEEEKLSIAD